MPARYHEPDVEEVEDEYDAGLREATGSTAAPSGWRGSTIGEQCLPHS